MQAYAALLEALGLAQSRNRKLALLAEYFRSVPDPDRGWALASLTDGVPVRVPLRRMLGDLVAGFMDPELYRMSRDYVGDTAETVALLWPDLPQAGPAPRLADVVLAMGHGTAGERTQRLKALLDASTATERWALLKFIGGAPRVGVSARLARTALAAGFDHDVDEIEQVWHALTPPYLDLFAWLDGRAPRPSTEGRAIFRPVMLAHPIEDADWAGLSPHEFAAEWKWDGIRIQIAAQSGELRIFRQLPFDARRARLEAWFVRHAPERTDLSPLIRFETFDALRTLWGGARDDGIEGLMLKRRDSAYIAGRVKGGWWKWKRAPMTLDCVLMYAQRGSGKRSSFYSDYTFGVWRDDDARELVPVGKAYSGFTDDELRQLDRWIRANTVDAFGPVRAVSPGLVLEVEFDAVQRSSRHKSGLAMRFPRIHRIRWDKPAAEADRLAAAFALLGRS